MLREETYLGSWNSKTDIAHLDEVMQAGWKVVVAGRQISQLHACTFGPAEETVACMIFEDGTCEVGIGENLRPYQLLYFGNDAGHGFEAFMLATIRHAVLKERTQ